MTNRVKITSEEILSNNFFPLKSISYLFEKKDGTTEEVKREVYNSSNGAVALLYNLEKDTVILTRQFRMPTYLNKNESGLLIEACAGIVEDGEHPADSIIREIEEEAGYKVSKVKKLFDLYSTPGSVTEMLSYFIAEYTDSQRIGEGGGLEDENEEIEVIEMPFDEAFSKLQSGEIKDAKTATLLLYAKIHLF